MTVTFHALWTLCALGAVVFATAAASRLRDRLAAAAGFVVAAGVFGPDRPQARLILTKNSGTLQTRPSTLAVRFVELHNQATLKDLRR